jgi:hypothetical protein
VELVEHFYLLVFLGQHLLLLITCTVDLMRRAVLVAQVGGLVYILLAAAAVGEVL